MIPNTNMKDESSSFVFPKSHPCKFSLGSHGEFGSSHFVQQKEQHKSLRTVLGPELSCLVYWLNLECPGLFFWFCSTDGSLEMQCMTGTGTSEARMDSSLQSFTCVASEDLTPEMFFPLTQADITIKTCKKLIC